MCLVIIDRGDESPKNKSLSKTNVNLKRKLKNNEIDEEEKEEEEMGQKNDEIENESNEKHKKKKNKKDKKAKKDKKEKKHKKYKKEEEKEIESEFKDTLDSPVIQPRVVCSLANCKLTERETNFIRALNMLLAS